MIIYIFVRLSRLWNVLTQNYVFESLLLRSLEGIFMFCPILKTSYKFRSIRGGAIFNLFFCIIVSMVIYFTSIGWLASMIFAGYVGLEIFKYFEKKKQAKIFIEESSTQEIKDRYKKIMIPLLKAHRLLCFYSVYLWAVSLIVYAIRP